MKSTSARRAFKKKSTVPIFGALLWIVICDSICKELKGFEPTFGKDRDDTEYHALHCYSLESGEFGIFLNRKAALDITDWSHEVFHATHRILQWASCNFDNDHHEQGALLNGYLNKLVQQAIAADRKRK